MLEKTSNNVIIQNKIFYSKIINHCYITTIPSSNEAYFVLQNNNVCSKHK
jgi:hypothetical protein